MSKSEIVAWMIMSVTSAAIGITLVIHTYPLGIFMSLVVFSISLVIVFIGIDGEVRKNEHR